jgi:ABC-type transport system involved in multi-copper enzyme maturation permease subunit
MRNFGLIYQYEIKKIVGRKHAVIAFLLIAVVALLLNLSSIYDYSVGAHGAHIAVGDAYHSPQALFHKIPIRYVDETGAVVEQSVGPLTYIRMQREFAMQWSGIELTDDVIQEMQEFIHTYNFTDETGRTYGWSFQNYYWVYETIVRLGLNPESEIATEQEIRNMIELQWTSLFDSEQLTAGERDYWASHERMAYPLVMAYNPAYAQLIQEAYWINIMLLFFAVIALSESFSTERARRTRKIVQATSHGPGKAILARICAGETVVVSAALILYLLSFGIQFALFGADGFQSPVQQVEGLHWTMLMLSTGAATLLLCGTSILLTAMVGAVTMLISELFQNSIAATAVPGAFFLFSLLFEYSLFYKNRTLSQLWNYFPIQRSSEALLLDERLISLGNKLLPAIPFSTMVYAAILVVSLASCAAVSITRRRDRS